MQWAAFARAAAAPGSHATPPTIFDINVVQFPPAYAVEGLHASEQAGVPVKFVELGNELYDPKQNQGRFTTGAEYAAAMRGFEEAVAHAFPAAQIATVACGASQHHGRAGARLWNAAALSHTSAGAATIHCYAELDDTLGIVASDAPGILQRAFAVAVDEADNIRETVPPHLRLWLTELGHIGNNRSVPQFATPTLDRTWLEGIFSAALLLLMVRVPQFDIVTPYCLACADWNSYAFTTERYGRLLPPALAGTVDWVPTPQGSLLTLILTAVRDAPSGCTMQELGFTPGLTLHPTEGGWGAAGRRGSDVRAARLLGWAFLL